MYHKIISGLLGLATLIAVSTFTTPVYAEVTFPEDAPVQVDTPTIKGPAVGSGAAQDNGDELSQNQLKTYREQQSKGFVQKHGLLAGLVLLVLALCIVGLFVRRSRRSRN